MIKNLLLVKKMAIKSNKKNLIIKDLFTKKYKPKIVKPKKGKGSFKRKKIQAYSLAPICCMTLADILVPSCKLSSIEYLFT